MPRGKDVSHIGIDTENGSGGFVCDVDIFDGHIGWRVGSQQFTARRVTFQRNHIAVWMGWDWGFLWKSIGMLANKVGINMTNYNGGGSQGIGSISLIGLLILHIPANKFIANAEFVDSQMVNLEDAGIVLKQSNPSAGIPNIVIENLKVMDFKADARGKEYMSSNMSIIRYEGVDPPILPITPQVDTWAMGNQVLDRSGAVTKAKGSFLSPSSRVPAVLKAPDGTVFERSKPQYETADKIMQVTSFGNKNNGSGDQSAMINKVLDLYKGSVVFFPAGVYDTISVPAGTKMVGAAGVRSWDMVQIFRMNQIHGLSSSQYTSHSSYSLS